MADRALLIEVTLLDARYHGVGDWPPAPWRLFQALVAGAHGGRWAAEDADAKDQALQWLETLNPPHIAAPPAVRGAETTYYVPNNSLDAKGGDPDRVAELRVPKRVRPTLLDGEPRLLYAWPYDRADEGLARIMAGLADRLHTLGRGIDPAFARAELLDWYEAEERLRAHGGTVARPDNRPGRPDRDPGCPEPGSLLSLKQRFAATRRQYQPGKEGRTRTLNFARPPKPAFRTIAYDRPPARTLYELRQEDGRFHPWPLWRAVELTTRLRDLAAAVLTRRLKDHAAQIDRFLVGREAGPADKDRRVRLIPLPSIGTQHTDASIRRLLLEIPPDCPLPRDEVVSVFSGLDLRLDPATGEVADRPEPTLVDSSDSGMTGQYGVGSAGARHWHSVTPLALPATRRRLDPGRLRDPDAQVRAQEYKTGQERQDEETRARAAVLEACRHAGLDPRSVLSIRLQREPFFLRGEGAERFADARFSRHRLWHLAISFTEPVAGPLLLGDGRWLGLGLMAPDKGAAVQADAVSYGLTPDARPPLAEGAAVTRAVRAALMSLARTPDGGVLPLFSGHLDGPGPARPGEHRHVYVAVLDTDGDGRLDQVQVIAPWRADRSFRPADKEKETLLDDFTRITNQLRQVRAGAAGLLSLSPPQALPAERGHVWTSRTRYRPTRHPDSAADSAAFIADDVRRELHRRGLPAPTAIEVSDSRVGPRKGLSARVTLHFAQPLTGPVLLGRDAHRGGGRFCADSHSPS
ncbi:type I-U CRISPR-associated protein Csb2 [Rhodospirillum centenum]|uniref:CRISPR-associated protein, GSU0054 family n=1 Tax=Rhodospirillum centenum (strain ATCC 51521 / SW) TaxID=414684 RepID=B6ITM3_RHOCS|nr:type I-U CRISPR-associated protein Csb2 [Rhodospirillum centenum]ACI99324.1 CRISPR-associated protein, GSU0054 family [Rhodospirillum centenum SW]